MRVAAAILFHVLKNCSNGNGQMWFLYQKSRLLTQQTWIALQVGPGLTNVVPPPEIKTANSANMDSIASGTRMG